MLEISNRKFFPHTAQVSVCGNIFRIAGSVSAKRIVSVLGYGFPHYGSSFRIAARASVCGKKFRMCGSVPGRVLAGEAPPRGKGPGEQLTISGNTLLGVLIISMIK